MDGRSGSDERAEAQAVQAVSWIEAALQAALGSDAGARPALAKQALRSAGVDPADAALESWLEAVAAELRNSHAVPVPTEMIDIIAERMLANRNQAVEAQANVRADVRTLLERGP